MYGTLDPELEVQRTIKRAELTAFCCVSSEGLSAQPRLTFTAKELLMGCEEEK